MKQDRKDPTTIQDGTGLEAADFFTTRRSAQAAIKSLHSMLCPGAPPALPPLRADRRLSWIAFLDRFPGSLSRTSGSEISGFQGPLHNAPRPTRNFCPVFAMLLAASEAPFRPLCKPRPAPPLGHFHIALPIRARRPGSEPPATQVPARAPANPLALADGMDTALSDMRNCE